MMAVYSYYSHSRLYAPLYFMSTVSMLTAMEEKRAEIRDKAITILAQHAIYKAKKGAFARPWVMELAESMPAYAWWEQNGASTPQLQQFAILVLSQPASASLCERINSEFGFVKDRCHNRLGHVKANKLVSLFHNGRVWSGLTTNAYVESAVGWCDTDTTSGVTKWGLTNYT